LPLFLGHAARGEAITLNGKGSRSQDFVAVEDAAWAHVACLTATVNKGIPINLGSGEETSMRELAQLARELCASEHGVSIINGPDDGSDNDRFVLDISQARALLGYRPMSLKEGLLKYKSALQ
jgi:nucleoside-diphosphate-sugar epimerase